MNLLLTAAALALAVTLVLGLVRVLRAPDTVERMLAAQLVGSTGIGLLLLLATLQDLPAAVDTALVLALLAAVAVAALTRTAPLETRRDH